jgi:hypothetical protein
MASENTPSAPKEPTDTTDEQGNELGAAMTTLGYERAWLHVQAPNADGRTPIRVQGEYLDDEPGHVTLSTTAEGYGLQLSLDPADARALASKLNSAASYAEGDR